MFFKIKLAKINKKTFLHLYIFLKQNRYLLSLVVGSVLPVAITFQEHNIIVLCSSDWIAIDKVRLFGRKQDDDAEHHKDSFVYANLVHRRDKSEMHFSQLRWKKPLDVLQTERWCELGDGCIDAPLFIRLICVSYKNYVNSWNIKQ